jgi:hypothetical protein
MSATTQQSPAATGMQRIPFPLESYEHPSLPLSAKKLVNLMAEQEPQDARTAAALISTPGLQTYLTVGTGPIKALDFSQPGRLYVVSGTHFYRCIFAPDPAAGIEDMGDIGVPDDPNKMITIGTGSTATVVCVPPRAYTCGHNTTGAIGGDPLQQLGGTFTGAASVAQMDNYWAFSDYADPARWFISRLMDPTDFDALDFAYSDAMPNVLERILGFRGQFWLMGQAGHEVWYDAGSSGLETTPGTSFFPFRRQPGAVISHGSFTPRSEVIIDSSVWWLGVDGIVYRSNSYNAQRVSTHAIEAVLSDCDVAFAYIWGGHTFYCITQGNRTFEYNCATKVWHERSSSADGTARWKINCACPFGSSYLLGDSLSGRLFLPIRNEPTDGDGYNVIRQAILPPLWANTRRAFCARLEVEMEVGAQSPTGDVTLDWSDTGGQSWDGGPRTMSAGAFYGDRRRVFTTRLGSFRQRIYRLTTHGCTSLYAVDADIAGGAT